MNAQDVISAFATLNENGEVASFNFAEFDKLVSELVTERAKIRKENKEVIKAQKEADNAVLAESGKAFYDGLAEGDVFTYKTADGTEVVARKIKTKSGSGNSAACEVISGLTIAEGKSAKRYPKFYQIVVPQVESAVAE
jgi:hypothetical protein